MREGIRNSVRTDKHTISINTTAFCIIEGTSTRNKKPVWRLEDGSVNEVPQSADLQNLPKAGFEILPRFREMNRNGRIPGISLAICIPSTPTLVVVSMYHTVPVFDGELGLPHSCGAGLDPLSVCPAHAWDSLSLRSFMYDTYK